MKTKKNVNNVLLILSVTTLFLITLLPLTSALPPWKSYEKLSTVSFNIIQNDPDYQVEFNVTSDWLYYTISNPSVKTYDHALCVPGDLEFSYDMDKDGKGTYKNVKNDAAKYEQLQLSGWCEEKDNWIRHKRN